SLSGTAIAAVNSPSSVTISGPADEIRAFLKRARSKRIAARQLDLDYPFHSALLAPIERPLVRALARLAPRDGKIPFISTVTGAVIDGATLDAKYWWHNVADRVRFKDAVEVAAKLGSQLFMEIGPKPLLKGNVLETLRSLSHRAEVLSAFEGAAEPGSDDPIRMLVARAYASGARGDERRLFGTAPTERVAVPHYPWLHSEFRHEQSAEAVDINGEATRHVLCGARLTTGSHEWLNLLDPVLIPTLADHVVDGEVVVPAAALAEMALGAGREIWPDGGLALEDFDILHPLVLRRDAIRDGLTRIDVTSKRVEIWSRTRGTSGDGVLHAAGRVLPIQSAPHAPPQPDEVLDRITDADAIYDATSACRLEYGPSFRLAGRAVYGDTVMDLALAPSERPEAGYRRFVVSPQSLDASFHPLLFRVRQRDGKPRAFLPVRFAALRVYRDDAEVVRAIMVREKETAQSFKANVALYDADGALVARLDGALFRSVVFERREQTATDVRQRWIAASPDAAGTRGSALIAGLKDRAAGDTPSAEPALLVEAFSRAIAWETLSARLGDRPVDLAAHGPAGSRSRVAIEALLGTLAAAGLASFVKGHWQLKPSGLPPAGAVLATLAADNPGASADIAVCAAVWSQLNAGLAGDIPVVVKREAIAHAEARSALIATLAETVSETVASLPAARDASAIRILVLAQGAASLVAPFMPQLRTGAVEIVVGCADQTQAERARIQYGTVAGIEILDLSSPAAGHPAWYDCVVAVAFSLGGAAFRLPDALSQHLRSDV
ncbi:MAG: acyltransferase domain-containing protein, partial [Alsobacter sp.]